MPMLSPLSLCMARATTQQGFLRRRDEGRGEHHLCATCCPFSILSMTNLAGRSAEVEARFKTESRFVYSQLRT